MMEMMSRRLSPLEEEYRCIGYRRELKARGYYSIWRHWRFWAHPGVYCKMMRMFVSFCSRITISASGIKCEGCPEIWIAMCE